MGSPSSSLFSNNAPPPIPGGYGNPAGANTGGVAGGGGGMPQMPLYNVGAYSGTSGGLQNLNSGLFNSSTDPYQQNLYNLLGKGYGQGAGQAIGDILSKGLFNPQVAAAFLNAMQPGIARGEGDIQQAFGAEGSRFGSAAALGLGDYMSQVNLNEQQTLASLFENAQSQEMGLLGTVLPTVAKEQANKGGLLKDILGGLETIGGIGLDAVTGGLGGNGLIAGGIGTLTGGGGGGSTSASTTPNSASISSQLQALLGNMGIGGGTTAITGSSQPAQVNDVQQLQSIIQMLQLSQNPLSPGGNSNNNQGLLGLLQGGLLQ